MFPTQEADKKVVYHVLENTKMQVIHCGESFWWAFFKRLF